MLLQHAAQRLLHVPACAIVRAGGHASSVINLMFLSVLPACADKFFYSTGWHMQRVMHSTSLFYYQFLPYCKFGGYKYNNI